MQIGQGESLVHFLCPALATRPSQAVVVVKSEQDGLSQTVQSIRADGKHITNPSTIDFSRLILSPFSLKITANSARSQSVYSFI